MGAYASQSNTELLLYDLEILRHHDSFSQRNINPVFKKNVEDLNQ